MLLDTEIAEERSVEHLGIEVRAPGGWVRVTHVCKTIHMRVWEVTTSGHHLSCAGKHLIITPKGPIPADQLEVGMIVCTDDGLETVKCVSESDDERQLYDLRVDSPDHIYFTDGIASHNSTGLGAAELFKLNTLSSYRSLYIAPLHEQVKTLAEKFMDMQRGSKFPPSYYAAKGIKNTMYYKGSATGGFLRLMHVLTDMGKVRGLSCNSVVVDECLRGDSKILTPLGEKLIIDIKPGDLVVSFDERLQQIVDKAVGVVFKGRRHTWTVDTARGYQLTATGNERIRTPGGWRYLAEFITSEAAEVCATSSEIKSRCGGHPPQTIVTRPLSGDGDLLEDEIVSITYAGEHDVYDIETEKHHTLFASGIAVHNCQDFDPEHLPEIVQVQKAFRESRTTIFAGTSKDMDTCLEHQFQIGSRGIWHVRCDCKDGWHPLNDAELLPKMMSVDGLVCPNNGHLLNPLNGEFVHEDKNMLEMKQVSFHLPQLIVPEYASGPAFLDIWRDYKKYPYKKFLQEVMGIAVDSGMSELTDADLKACCSDKTFAQIQQSYLSGKTRYAHVFSGCDWGGSDWNPATKSKQSYTVHTIYGLTGDGIMELIYAFRYAGMNYQEIAGNIVAAHNKFKAFGIGTDNGGGSYYNAYMRDCGRIPTNRIISFNYTDTKLLLERIPHPEAHIMSLHRSDSISALISDVKSQKIRWPRWDDSEGFVSDFLNMRRNITEAPSGRSVLRYIRHGAKADDFMQSTNYAMMMKRIVTQESLIPNRQILRELSGLFGNNGHPVAIDIGGSMGGYFSG